MRCACVVHAIVRRRFPALAPRLTRFRRPLPTPRPARKTPPHLSGRGPSGMLGTFRNRRAGVLIWALLAALVVGLAGFGIGAGRGITSQTVAKVGGRAGRPPTTTSAPCSRSSAPCTSRLGRDLAMAEARQYGVDRMVLARLVNDAALDDEAARLGVSTGDDAVRDQVMATPAFQGPDGKFDRDTYTDALERTGLRPAEFEDAPPPRSRPATSSPAASRPPPPCPDAEALTVLAFLGEKRSFDWIRLDAALLPDARSPPPPTPTSQAEHDAHAADRYTRPETRADHLRQRHPRQPSPPTIEIPDADLRAAYDADIAHYQTPERRALDRIGFATEAEAAAAKARLDAGDDRLRRPRRRARPQARRHRPGHRRRRRPRRPRPATPSSAPPGPASSARSPPRSAPRSTAINAIMAAKTTPFEEARAELAKTRALDAGQASRSPTTPPHIEDLIAGGATARGDRLRDRRWSSARVALNSETTRRHRRRPRLPRRRRQGRGRRGDRPRSSSPTAASPPSASTAIDPPAVIPLAEIRDRVAADWTADQTAEALHQARRRLHRRAQGRPRLRRPRRSASTARSAAPARSPAARPPHGAPARARRRRLRRRRRRRRHPPRRRRRDPRRSSPRSSPSTPRPTPTRRDRSTNLRGQYREQVARRRPRALHRGAARPGRRHGEPGADRLDPRALPLSRDAALPRDRGLRRRPSRAGRNQVVWTRLVADLDTPVIADAEADRGAQGQLPARERHRRRGARPLLDHGHEARPDLGVPRHRRPDQPLRPLRPRRLARRARRPARQPARAHRREPHRAARPSCRRWRPASSATSATTWCASSSACRTSTPTRSACPTRSCCAPRSC